MGGLQELAQHIGADQRTLRRGVEQGTVRARRSTPRRLEVSPDEQRYLRRHWGLLATLRRALRTERRVRLAVLYGSLATGAASPDSDIDLLVSHDGAALDRAALAERLSRVAGQRVHVIALDAARHAPSLLADVLEEGRVLVDRDGAWRALKDQQPDILAAARRDEDLTASRADEAVAAARTRL
jgi:predicted nucleotidyltransferase